jgi:hypothetical protein
MRTAATVTTRLGRPFEPLGVKDCDVDSPGIVAFGALTGGWVAAQRRVALTQSAVLTIDNVLYQTQG